MTRGKIYFAATHTALNFFEGRGGFKKLTELTNGQIGLLGNRLVKISLSLMPVNYVNVQLK